MKIRLPSDLTNAFPFFALRRQAVLVVIEQQKLKAKTVVNAGQAHKDKKIRQRQRRRKQRALSFLVTTRGEEQ